MAGYLEDYHMGAFRQGVRGAAAMVLGPVAALMAGEQACTFVAEGRLMEVGELVVVFFVWPVAAWFSWQGAVCGLVTAGLLVRYWLSDAWRAEKLLAVAVWLALGGLWLGRWPGWGGAFRAAGVLAAVAAGYGGVRLAVWWFWRRRVHKALEAQRRNRRQKRPGRPVRRSVRGRGDWVGWGGGS